VCVETWSVVPPCLACSAGTWSVASPRWLARRGHGRSLRLLGRDLVGRPLRWLAWRGHGWPLRLAGLLDGDLIDHSALLACSAGTWSYSQKVYGLYRKYSAKRHLLTFFCREVFANAILGKDFAKYKDFFANCSDALGKKKLVYTAVCGRGVGPRCKEFIKFSHSFFEFISASCSLEPPIQDELPVKIYFYRRQSHPLVKSSLFHWPSISHWPIQPTISKTQRTERR
jgi:hypothetical protein